jgi:hypothetical protein
MEAIEPRMRTVDVEGREAGEKAWRWEGRMRGVARDMVVVGVLVKEWCSVENECFWWMRARARIRLARTAEIGWLNEREK